jgi:hypothetical protein
MIEDIDDFLIFADIFGDDFVMMAHALKDLALVEDPVRRIESRLTYAEHKAYPRWVRTVIWSDRTVVEQWKRCYRAKFGILDLGD